MFLIFFVKYWPVHDNVRNIPLTCVRYMVYGSCYIRSLTVPPPPPDGRIPTKIRDPLRAGDPVIVNTRVVHVYVAAIGWERNREAAAFPVFRHDATQSRTGDGNNDDDNDIIVYYRIIVDATIVCHCYRRVTAAKTSTHR